MNMRNLYRDYTGRQGGSAPNTEAVQRLSILHAALKFFLLSLIELSGSSSQHEDAQSIHAGWDASIAQEIIDNYINSNKRC